MTLTETPFTIDNLPYGVISTAETPTPRCATVLEDDVIDLSALEKDGYFKSIPGFKGEVFSTVSDRHQSLLDFLINKA